MKKLSLKKISDLCDALEVVGQGQDLNLPNSTPFLCAVEAVSRLQLWCLCPTTSGASALSCVPVMLRGVSALQGITLVTQISSAAELLLRQSQKPGGLVLLPLPTVRKVRLCALEGGWTGCNGLHLKTGSSKVSAHPWYPEDISSLTSVFLAVMFRLYDSDENGLLDQAVSSPNIPPRSNKDWGRGEQVKGESKHSQLHLRRNSSVSIWAAEMTRSPRLLLPKSPPRGEWTPTCFFIPEAQIAKSQVGEML